MCSGYQWLTSDLDNQSLTPVNRSFILIAKHTPALLTYHISGMLPSCKSINSIFRFCSIWKNGARKCYSFTETIAWGFKLGIQSHTPQTSKAAPVSINQFPCPHCLTLAALPVLGTNSCYATLAYNGGRPPGRWAWGPRSVYVDRLGL